MEAEISTMRDAPPELLAPLAAFPPAIAPLHLTVRDGSGSRLTSR